MKEIGFIGLGAMGAHMVRHLLAAGFSVHVFDTQEAALDAAETLGAKRRRTAAEVASAADAVIVCLPTPAIVQRVALGKDGIVDGNRAKIYVDCSTTGPSTAKTVADGLASKGIVALDGPLAGGAPGAQAGTLSVMVSGQPAAFETMKPVFEAFGRKVVHVGDGVGQGQALKLINNMIVGATLVTAAEATLFGVKFGLDPATIIDLVNSATGRSYTVEELLGRRVLDRTFDFGFRLELMLKDLRLCVTEAEAAGAPMAVNTLAKHYYEQAAAQGRGAEDLTVVVELLETAAQAKIARRDI